MSRAFVSLVTSHRALTFGLLGLVAVIGPRAQAQTDTLEATCTGRIEKTADERIRACSTMIETGSFEGDGLAVVYTSRGSAWRTKGDLDRALADQNEAVRIRPESAILYFNRAATWQAKRDPQRAISDYDQALRIAPNFTLAFKRRGDLQFSAANYDLAVADYSSALRLKPDYAEALVRRGLAKLERGDVEGRNADLQEAHFLERGIVKSVLVSLGDDALHGQGFLVPRQTEVFTALMLDGATICLEASQTSEGLLKAFFDAQRMRFTSKPFPNLTDAIRAFTGGDCTVLAAEIPTLKRELSRLSNSREYALLPEIFGPPQKTRAVAMVTASAIRRSKVAGGQGGEPFDDQAANAEGRPMTAITITAARSVANRRQKFIAKVQAHWAGTAGPVHGGAGGAVILDPETQTIEFSGGEIVQRMTIFYRRFDWPDAANAPVWISGIRLHTSKSSYTVGDVEGSTAECTVDPGEHIVGLFGRSGAYVDALGCLIR